jgi:hypothetical protein
MYTFSHEQLGKMLHGAIETFLEFRDQHGYPEERARFSAVTELLDGLDAERQLVSDGEIARTTMQVLDDQGQDAEDPNLYEHLGQAPWNQSNDVTFEAASAAWERVNGDRPVDPCDVCRKAVCDGCEAELGLAADLSRSE